jgi:hypothetical protein
VKSPSFPWIFCDLCVSRSIRFYAFSNPTQEWRKAKMTSRSESSEPSLFEQVEPRVVLAPAQMTELAALLEVLLLEIARALASGEIGK